MLLFILLFIFYIYFIDNRNKQKKETKTKQNNNFALILGVKINYCMKQNFVLFLLQNMLLREMNFESC